MTYPEKLVDKRTVDRYIDKGLVDRNVFAKQLSSLPDAEGNMEIVECIQAPEEEPAQETFPEEPEA